MNVSVLLSSVERRQTKLMICYLYNKTKQTKERKGFEKFMGFRNVRLTKPKNLSQAVFMRQELPVVEAIMVNQMALAYILKI